MNFMEYLLYLNKIFIGNIKAAETRRINSVSGPRRRAHSCQISDICLIASQTSQYHLCKDAMSQVTALPSLESKSTCSINSLWYFQHDGWILEWGPLNIPKLQHSKNCPHPKCHLRFFSQISPSTRSHRVDYSIQNKQKELLQAIAFDIGEEVTCHK